MPTTMVMGAPTASVQAITTSSCTCWTSLVIRVMSDGAPKCPTSRAEKSVTGGTARRARPGRSPWPPWPRSRRRQMANTTWTRVKPEHDRRPMRADVAWLCREDAVVDDVGVEGRQGQGGTSARPGGGRRGQEQRSVRAQMGSRRSGSARPLLEADAVEEQRATSAGPAARRRPQGWVTARVKDAQGAGRDRRARRAGRSPAGRRTGDQRLAVDRRAPGVLVRTGRRRWTSAARRRRPAAGGRPRPRSPVLERQAGLDRRRGPGRGPQCRGRASMTASIRSSLPAKTRKMVPSAMPAASAMSRVVDHLARARGAAAGRRRRSSSGARRPAGRWPAVGELPPCSRPERHSRSSRISE